jgi:hypothetical protein
MRILGYFTRHGEHVGPVALEDRAMVLGFLEVHLFDDEVILADPDDRLVFRAVDGVDLISRLDELGIDLPALYRSLRRAAVSAASDAEDEREPWEDLYDGIGLSPGEIAMRQRAKRAARAARTVADVVELLAGTYFDASFVTEDGSRSWAYFDPDDLSVLERLADGGTGKRIVLSPDARVRHRGSGEDIHNFVLLDPPPARAASPD